MLLEYGAKDTGSTGWPCILLAAERGHVQVGMDYCLLHIRRLLQFFFSQVVSMLMHYGSRANTVAISGWTPLQV